MRRVVHQYLRRRALTAPPMLTGQHLDEDALNAFVEGRLSEIESAPLIQHLVACAYCRHFTAQLVRLDTEIGESESQMIQQAEEPGRIRRLLENLATRVLPESEGDTVFAYHAPAEDFQRKEGVRGDKRVTLNEGEADKRQE